MYASKMCSKSHNYSQNSHIIVTNSHSLGHIQERTSQYQFTASASVNSTIPHKPSNHLIIIHNNTKHLTYQPYGGSGQAQSRAGAR